MLLRCPISTFPQEMELPGPPPFPFSAACREDGRQHKPSAGCPRRRLWLPAGPPRASVCGPGEEPGTGPRRQGLDTDRPTAMPDRNCTETVQKPFGDRSRRARGELEQCPQKPLFENRLLKKKILESNGFCAMSSLSLPSSVGFSTERFLYGFCAASDTASVSPPP